VVVVVAAPVQQRGAGTRAGLAVASLGCGLAGLPARPAGMAAALVLAG
jgi:hypothetical protein